MREYDEGAIRSVFIVEDDADFLFATMLKRGRGMDPGAMPESPGAETHAKALYSRWLEREARQHGLPTLRPVPWETLAE